VHNKFWPFPIILFFSKASPNIEGRTEEDRLDGLVLKDIVQRPKEPSSSKLIIENNGRGLYYHFSFPIGGLGAPGRDVGAKRMRRASTVASHVPDVLPIQLPTGKEMPLDASSPKAFQRKYQKMSI
jgi:hypothetical protein